MLYELTVRGTVSGETYINRYNYNSGGVGAAVTGSFALASAWGAVPEPITGNITPLTPFAWFLSIASAQTRIMEITVAALYDPLDFYSVPYPVGKLGSQAGVPMSPFLVYPLQTNIVRTDVGRGSKGIGGCVEDLVEANGVIQASAMDFLASLSAALSDVLEYDDEGSGFTFTPAILSKEEYTTPRGNRAYKKYETLAEQLEHTALGITWQPKPEISTRNSRKRGHGS